MAGPTGSITGKPIKLVPKLLNSTSTITSDSFSRVGYYGSSSTNFFENNLHGEYFIIPDCDYITVTYGRQESNSSYGYFSTWNTLGTYAISDLLNNPKALSWTWYGANGDTNTCRVRMGVVYIGYGASSGNGRTINELELGLKFLGNGSNSSNYDGYVAIQFYKYFLDV